MPNDRPFPMLPMSLTQQMDAVLDQVLTRLAGPSSASPFDLDSALLTPAETPVERVIPAARASLGLGKGELLCLWLLIRVETEARLAQRIAGLQSGSTQVRPALALLTGIAALAQSAPPSAEALLRGPLFTLPLARMVRQDSDLPLAVTPVALSPALMAVLGLPSPVAFAPESRQITPPETYAAAAAALAGRIRGRQVALMLRGGLPDDQQLFARALAEVLGRPLRPLPADAASIPGLGAALMLGHALPYDTPRPAAGQRAPLANLAPLASPRVVALGEEGGVDLPEWEALEVTLPPLSDHDRRAIWGAGAEGLPLAGLGPSRLAALSARMALAPPGQSPQTAFRTAAGAEARPDIEPHGRLIAAHVTDAALVATPELRAELDLLAARCLQRRATHALGPAFQGQETGVRALFNGPSGSGKTLACSWLATRLGLPLFRVDLASVQSKYIGETEENLSRILDRAEAAEVILLFDEADSLFGARTETHDASDRFANNQTNFLLTRIESYGGIVLLTTNSRQRIDPAFSRRIDQIIEVPIPDPAARRGIWRAHLGEAHRLTAAEINRLASAADIAGGHIRAIVQTAQVLAVAAGAPIGPAELRRALVLEYRKIGRTPPSLLVTGW